MDTSYAFGTHKHLVLVTGLEPEATLLGLIATELRKHGPLEEVLVGISMQFECRRCRETHKVTDDTVIALTEGQEAKELAEAIEALSAGNPKFAELVAYEQETMDGTSALDELDELIDLLVEMPPEVQFELLNLILDGEGGRA